MEKWSKGRRFFSTEKGLLGQAPEKAKKGDLVCVFYGSKVPFVILPVKNEYEIVGECYVDGYMRGEALRKGAGQEEELRFGQRLQNMSDRWSSTVRNGPKTKL